MKNRHGPRQSYGQIPKPNNPKNFLPKHSITAVMYEVQTLAKSLKSQQGIAEKPHSGLGLIDRLWRKREHRQGGREKHELVRKKNWIQKKKAGGNTTMEK